jgi:hypothetical protein
VRKAHNVASVEKTAVGTYCVSFTDNIQVDSQDDAVVISTTNATFLSPTVSNCGPESVRVVIARTSNAAPEDNGFSVVVP